MHILTIHFSLMRSSAPLGWVQLFHWLLGLDSVGPERLKLALVFDIRFSSVLFDGLGKIDLAARDDVIG